jgi:RNA polymerase sigma factor (sigma-70 family)
VSTAEALTGCEPYVTYRRAPIFSHDDARFGSFYVGEPVSNRPAHYACLLGFLRRKGRSREDAEDLIQEAMLRLHLYGKKAVVVNEEAFLRHAVRNLAIDHYRRDRSVLGLEVRLEDVDRLHPLTAPSRTPDQILDCQQCLHELATVLDAVSCRTREIYLARLSGYTYAEIASDMSIAEITVKRHISRARSIVEKYYRPMFRLLQ